MKTGMVHILVVGAFWFAFVATSRSDAATANAGFDGTWKSTWSEKQGGATFVESLVMTIKRGHATQLLNYTATLDSSEDDWGFLPSEFAQVSPLRYTERRESTAIIYKAGTMEITWGPPQLIDWSPKAIPRHFIEAEMHQEAKAHRDTYQMRGDTLIEPNLTWHRISTGQRATQQTTATSASSRRATKQTTVTSAGVGGTWRGTINFGIGGTWNLQLQVAPDGSSVTESGGLAKLRYTATRSANGIAWRSGVFKEVEWTLTPQSDGRTAIVTAKSALGFNDTATFQR